VLVVLQERLWAEVLLVAQTQLLVALLLLVAAVVGRLVLKV
jgi:hypothetical protein